MQILTALAKKKEAKKKYGAARLIHTSAPYGLADALRAETSSPAASSVELFPFIVRFPSAPYGLAEPRSRRHAKCRGPRLEHGRAFPGLHEKNRKIPLSPFETTPVEKPRIGIIRFRNERLYGFSCVSGDNVGFLSVVSGIRCRTPAQRPTSYAVFVGSNPLPFGKTSHPQLYAAVRQALFF